MTTSVQEFRLRFNTEYPKNNSLLPWRLLVGSDLNNFKEIPAQEVTFNTPSWNTVDEIPNVGRKWHIACHGVLKDVGAGQFVVASPTGVGTFSKKDSVAGQRLHPFGMVRMNFNPRHVDFPTDTPPWQCVYGGEDGVSEWKRIRVAKIQCNVLTLTTRTVFSTGPKWHFGGHGVPYLIEDNTGNTLVINPR